MHDGAVDGEVNRGRRDADFEGVHRGAVWAWLADGRIESRSTIILPRRPTNDLPYDWWAVAHRLTLRLTDFYPSLNAVVLRELTNPEQRRRLSLVAMPADRLGRAATADYLLRAIFDADPAALATPAALVGWLARYHHDLPGPLPPALHARLHDQLSTVPAFAGWPLAELLDDRAAFGRFVTGEWAGYLAAAWAEMKDPKDPAVAWVGGMDVESVNQFIVGFRNGVAHYNKLKNKEVRVLGGYVGDFGDFEAGFKLAGGFLDDGADVVFGAGSISGNGAIAAAQKYGKWAIGVDTDQYNTLPDQQDVILTSCLKRMDRAVNQVVTAALEHQFWGGTRYVGNLANHGVGLAPFHKYEDQIPERLQKEIVDIQRNLLEGDLSTGWPEKPAKKASAKD